MTLILRFAAKTAVQLCCINYSETFFQFELQ